MAEESTRHERELVAEPAEPRLKKPPLYQVVLLNDDYTPMEFVVDVLESIFGMDRTTATRVMLEVHTKGKGVCGVFTFEIAETKVAQVTTYARQHQHPLFARWKKREAVPTSSATSNGYSGARDCTEPFRDATAPT